MCNFTLSAEFNVEFVCCFTRLSYNQCVGLLSICYLHSIHSILNNPSPMTSIIRANLYKDQNKSNPRIIYKELLDKRMTSDKNIFRNKQVLLLHILTKFVQSNFWSWKLLWTLRKNHSEERIGWHHGEIVLHLQSIEVLGSFEMACDHLGGVSKFLKYSEIVFGASVLKPK